MTDLVIVENSIPLADSRIVAEKLGVDHHDFFNNIIVKYRDEIEGDFGIVRFENAKIKGRGRPEKYALLTEDQTNVYMSYSRNTEQARACKRMLVKAFSDAKKIIAQLLQGQRVLTEQEIFNQSFHQRCVKNASRVPDGYFLIAIEMGKEAWSERAYHVELQYNRLPDGSAGLKWPNHLRKIGWDVDRRISVPCELPNGNYGNVWAYPEEYLLEFRRWMRNEYKDHFVNRYAPPRLLRPDNQKRIG